MNPTTAGAAPYHGDRAGEVLPEVGTNASAIADPATDQPGKPAPGPADEGAHNPVTLDALLARLPRRWFISPDPEVAARQKDKGPLDHALVSLVAIRARNTPAILRAMLECALPELRELVDEVVTEDKATPEPRRWTTAELEALPWKETPAPEDQVELTPGTFTRWLGSSNQIMALAKVKRQPEVRAWQARLDDGGREELAGVLDRLPKPPRASVPFVTRYALCVGDGLEVAEIAATPAAAVHAHFEHLVRAFGTAEACESSVGGVPEGDLGDWLLERYGAGLRIVKLRIPVGAEGALVGDACRLAGGAE